MKKNWRFEDINKEMEINWSTIFSLYTLTVCVVNWAQVLVDWTDQRSMAIGQRFSVFGLRCWWTGLINGKWPLVNDFQSLYLDSLCAKLGSGAGGLD